MTTDKTIEAVARALHALAAKYSPIEKDWESLADVEKQRYRQRARAAITSYREHLKAEGMGDVEEMNALFDLQWEADRRATKMWQEANPGNDLVWPDRSNMVVWLLDELDKARAMITAHKEQ